MPPVEFPRVSIIIPVYNGERYLAEAIHSVLAQTYKDHELIVVDDGSTDGSAVIAKSFGGEAIRYLYQANGGVCKARNTGIAAARGAFLAFLDQDDLWLPEKLAAQVAYLDSHPDVGAVYTQCQLMENGMPLSVLYSEPVKPYPLGIMVSGIGLQMTATMFRREVLQELGGFDEAFISGHEDIELTIRLSEVAQFAYLPNALSVYRFHSANASRTERFATDSRGLYLRKCLDRYGRDPSIACFLYRQMVGYYADIGMVQIKAGCPAEGRASLRQAIRLSLEKRTNGKMLIRSLRRLVRSYFPILREQGK